VPVQKTPGEPSLFLVRTATPAAAEIERSQKELRLDIEELTADGSDEESLLLARHLNVPAGASSARWIGALTTGSYRQFVEFFFANDGEPIDGDGRHVISTQRSLLNFSGVTHLAQAIPTGATDSMTENAFLHEATTPTKDGEVRLYTNPDAFPKAFMVPNAVVIPADDEARAYLRENGDGVANTITVRGPTPPTTTQLTHPTGANEVTITTYTDTQISMSVSTEHGGWLVVSDVTTPEWHTTVNGEPHPHYAANTLFKTAYVPAGNHTVSFTYASPAIRQSQLATPLGIALLFALLSPQLWHRIKRHD